MNIYIRNLLIFIIIPLLSSCFESSKVDTTNNEVRKFVWTNMNKYYLWNTQIPEDRTPNSNGDMNPEAYFNSLLYTDLDKWSFITADYDALINRYKGVTTSYGWSIKYIQPNPSSARVSAIITFVYKDSPADKAGLKRGDVIYNFNNENISFNNYRGFHEHTGKILIKYGHHKDGKLVENGKTLELSDTELNKNPLLERNIIESGAKKIGYLHYSSFIRDQQDLITNVFKEFKSEGVNEFILDLRYNGGGSVNTALHLCSFFAPKEAQNKPFLKQIWNSDIHEEFKQQEGEGYNIDTLPENDYNLDIERLFVITTGNTASASELLINCLRPYIDIIIVGTKTHGKYVGSVTIRDSKNTKISNWAMQPIVIRAANINEKTDYVNGFSPYENNKILDGTDDYSHQLGDVNEPCLKHTLSIINGTLASIKLSDSYKHPHIIDYWSDDIDFMYFN